MSVARLSRPGFGPTCLIPDPSSLILHRVRLAAFLALALAATSTARAHNPDTSYTRVEISADWLELRFTFDLEVLERVAPIDRDADGFVTEDELRAAAPGVVRFLRQSIDCEVNEYVADFGDAAPPVWPADAGKVGRADRQVTLVHFPFRKRIQELPESISLIYRIFDALGDGHTMLATFHEPGLAEHEVVFNYLEPDYLYFTEVEPSDSAAAVFAQLLKFLQLGVEHILIGYDHILFLLALIAVDRFSTLLKIITSFTVAHTITLILAALGVVSLPSRFIESAIAATIMYVALENLWATNTSHRWLLTFFFGLVHGFGFANVLSNLDLPTAGLVRCLVSFNIGVELGQVLIVAAVWPLWRLAARRPWGVKVMRGISVVIFAFGAAWFADRAFGLEFMPF
jgi:energy-converting hydrogenase Eha subunit E